MTISAQNLCLAGRLAGITAALRPGEITAICGPNGAGKSSLLGLMAGLLTPTSGTVMLGDAPITAHSPQARARAIGYLPQSPELAWDVSVEVLVSLGRLPWPGAPDSENRAAIDAALAALDLAALRRRAVSQLSGGERARALIARVLATRPAWLLADEPLANLDLAHAAALIGQLRTLADEGMGVVLVLHDLAWAMNHAQRVLVLHQGKLVADGPPDQALAAATISQVWGIAARWLGEPGAKALSL
jgi:iron complex transport system ATP-binding protein